MVAIDKVLKNWFVLFTKPGHELKVLDHLSDIGIEVYTPTKIEVRKWSDRKKKVKTCLLPSMILVCLQEKEVDKVFEVPGVRRYLFMDGKRAKVSNDEVLAMKLYTENTYQMSDEKELLLGSMIKIPLLNQEAELLSIKGNHCIARLEMLGALVSYQLS